MTLIAVGPRNALTMHHARLHQTVVHLLTAVRRQWTGSPLHINRLHMGGVVEYKAGSLQNAADKTVANMQFIVDSKVHFWSCQQLLVVGRVGNHLLMSIDGQCQIPQSIEYIHSMPGIIQKPGIQSHSELSNSGSPQALIELRS